MKRVLIIMILVILLVSMFVLPASADVTDSVYIYSDGDIEIVIESNQLTDRQIENIFSHFTNNTAGETVPYNLLCTLFGHKMEYASANIITHNYYSSVPHCKKDTYNVGTCERCDYTESELIRTERVGCH